jgi:hypothetical protein
MTSPATPDDAIRRWSLLFDSGETYGRRHTQREWAYTAAAVRKADTMARFAAETTNPIHRGDARWCHAAISAYEALHATPTDVDLDGSPEPRPACVGNGHIIRAWLSAPWTPPGHSEPTTNLQANVLDFLLEPEQREPFWLSTVVDLAQELGVFGAPGHHISLRLAGGTRRRRRRGHGVACRHPAVDVAAVSRDRPSPRWPFTHRHRRRRAPGRHRRDQPPL